MQKVVTIVLIISIAFSLKVYGADTNKVYGVTIDGIGKLNNIVNSLSKHKKKITTRIVFDEWINASEYSTAVNKIHKVSNIMGEILDSYYMKRYTLDDYVLRVNDYLNTLNTSIDLWEIGNEINGEWLGSTSSVIAKIDTAYSLVKARKYKTAITLYYNYDCWEKPQNEMFRWAINNIPQDVKEGLDYVWVSYYEDDCNGLQPNWQKVFDSLSTIFPNSKIGIGECGTKKLNKKAEYIRRYYKMKINNPNYVGGYFWWYYRQDCVPNTNPLWETLDSALSEKFDIGSITPDIKIDNYPNPFNPSTIINYEIPAGSNASLKLYDISGKMIKELVNEWKPAGKYQLQFVPENFSSGIYFLKMESSGLVVTKKITYIK